jgi:hypothetical protein
MLLFPQKHDPKLPLTIRVMSRQKWGKTITERRFATKTAGCFFPVGHLPRDSKIVRRFRIRLPIYHARKWWWSTTFCRRKMRRPLGGFGDLYHRTPILPNHIFQLGPRWMRSCFHAETMAAVRTFLLKMKTGCQKKLFWFSLAWLNPRMDFKRCPLSAFHQNATIKLIWT